MFWIPLWRHRALAWRLTRREVESRYRGTFLGLLWSVLQPLMMLSIYTVIFSVIFQARWTSTTDQQTSSPLLFAINLFAGLIVFNLAAECLLKGPGLVLVNPGYVRKVVFPLAILAPVSVAGALFTALTSLLMLAGFELLAMHALPLSWLYLPLVWLPLILGCCSVSWLLAALGVYLRDLAQLVGLLVNILLYISPIFYPINALPPHWRPILQLNPLAWAIEVTRDVLVNGVVPHAGLMVGAISIGLLFCQLSWQFFQRASRGFADVL